MKKQNKTLAYELASALDDLDSLSAYMLLTETYREEHLQRILNKVMSIPADKIKRSRGALFTYLVKQNGGKEHFGD